MKLLYLAMSALASAQLQLIMYQVGEAGEDLGGVSVSTDFGLLWSTDGTTWNEADSNNGAAPCSAICPSFVTFAIPGQPEAVNACQSNIGGAGECVPGGTFDCSFSTSTGSAEFTSTTDASFFGLGNAIGSYCGGTMPLNFEEGL